jgi:hypothetical protein
MAARRKVADMQTQAQISKKVATHARLRIQPEGSARKGNSAHTSLVVCLHRIDHVCQSHRLPLRSMSMWRARSAQGKAPAVRERGSINRMRADGAGDACAPREFALIGSCSSRRWTDGRSSAPCHHVLWSSKSGTLFSDLKSEDLILKGASFAVAKMSQGLKPGEMRKRVWHDRKYGTVGYTRDPPAASGRPARARP